VFFAPAAFAVKFSCPLKNSFTLRQTASDCA
jgi:hypothetical protein